ncbi:hypothetical protein SLA2020_189640 [Shorea laevis]
MGNDDDPVADVSFLAGEVKEIVDDPFSGMIIDEMFTANGNHVAAYASELFDIFLGPVLIFHWSKSSKKLMLMI